MSSRNVDINSFKEEIGLDNESLKELYLVFTDELEQQKEELKECLESESLGEIQKIVHNIKGISSSYRADEVYQKAKAIDARLKNNKDYSNLEASISHLNEVIGQAVTEIKSYFEEDLS